MSPRSLVLALSCGLVLVAVGLATVIDGAQQPGPPVSTPPDPAVARSSSTVEAIEVLRAWDERRSRAWSRGDVRALRRLYTPQSRSGRHDRAALASYVARGLRVAGLRTQVLAVEVDRETERLLVLRVTDRITGATARGRGRGVVLPRDEPTSWRLVMRRGSGEWRVAGIRRARP